MLKYGVFFITVFCSVHSQRPWHAGSSNRLPAVLPQYLDEQTATSQGTQGAPAPSVNVDATIANRIDASDDVFTSPQFPLTTSAINIPFDLPVDAHGDIDLINRIKTWPRDKQPFWYLNWQAIQAHRGDVNNNVQPAQTQPSTRSFFAG